MRNKPRKKIICNLPLKELTDIFNQIQTFHTVRLAKEMWDIEEKILKKEKLWPHFFNSWKKSRIEYSIIGRHYYTIDYKKENFEKDFLDFSHTYYQEDKSIKSERISLVRRMIEKDEDVIRDICALYLVEKEGENPIIISRYRLQP